MPHYPFKRRLDDDELKEVQGLVSLSPKLKLVKQHILKQFGKKVILKDIQNVRTKAKSQAKGGRDGAQVMIDRLEEEMQKDQGSKGGVIVSENNELSIVYFASSHLISLYEKFPEVIMIDGTYNVNTSRMPLYSVMIEDGNGHGRTVFYAATTDESTQHLRAIVQAFKNCNPCYGNTKVIIIDKDFTEMAVLKEEFPTATILFCQFHVIKCFYKAVSDADVPKDRRDSLRKVLHDIVYSESMDDYVDYLAEIVRLGNPTFEKYFLDNWSSCLEMWISFQRDSSVHFGNTTNNRLECSHSKLKDLISRTSSLSEMFEGVLIFISFINQESDHRAFVEQFTSLSTKLDHVPGMKEITANCTGYATKLLQNQVEVAQKVDYEFVNTDGAEVMVKYKDHTHNVDTEVWICSCSFWNTMLLPCRHIIGTRLYKGLSAFDVSVINQRWLKSYQIDFVAEDTPHDDDTGGSINYSPEYDLLPAPPMQTTLNQAQKYKKMLNLCQKIASQASVVGMPQFREMYNTVETLVKNWDSGSKCVVVNCDDDCEILSIEESTPDVLVNSTPNIESVECEIEVHSDNTQNDSTDDTPQNGDTDDTPQNGDTNDTPQNGDTNDTRPNGDTSRRCGVTRHNHTAQLEDQIAQEAEKGTMQHNSILHSNKQMHLGKIEDTSGASQQQHVQLTAASIDRKSIHLKPRIKVRGRPRFSSKLWPSKSKKQKNTLNTPKENVQPNVQVDNTGK